MIRLLTDKKFYLLVLIFTLSSFTFAQVKNKLQYLGNNSSYPYEFINQEGKPDGLSIDLIKAISKEMNFEIDVKLAPWKDVSRSIRYGTDFDISAMFYSDEAAQTVDFSDPVIFSEDEIFVRKNTDDINSTLDLMNKKVAVLEGSFTEYYLERNLPAVNLVFAGSEPGALEMLSKGMCDAAIVERLVGERNIARLDIKNIKAAAYPIIPRAYGFVVAKGDSSLLANINVGLAVIKRNGTYAAIFDKWINQTAPETISVQTIITWGIISVAIILLITGIIFLWIKSLRRLVSIRTAALRYELEEHVKAAEELIIQKEKAEESNRLKSEFLAQISHEIRTPLNVILSYLSLLEMEFKDQFTEDITEVMDSIKESSDRLLRTVTSILDMSALKANKFKVEFEKININELLNKLLKSFQKQAKDKKLELNLQQDVTGACVNADYYTTTKLFENIIDNSIKYTDKGSINIKLVRENVRFAVEIKDTGIGISEEYMTKIFESFTQESTGYTRKFEGNGLGLTLVKEYSRINNFEIKINSEKGSGTVIKVLMPAN